MYAHEFKELLTGLNIEFTETVISESKKRKMTTPVNEKANNFTKQVVIKFKNLQNRNSSRTFHEINTKKHF